MSENFDELGELGDKIKKIIDTAVSTKDYRQMTEDIKQTVGQTVNSAVNSAVDSGSEAIKNGLNNVFGTGNSQSGDSGVYRNKTKEFEEKRRRGIRPEVQGEGRDHPRHRGPPQRCGAPDHRGLSGAGGGRYFCGPSRRPARESGELHQAAGAA